MLHVLPDLHFVHDRLVTFVLVLMSLFDEFYGIELPIFLAPGQVYFAETPDRQTVINLIIEDSIFLSRFHEALQTQAFVNFPLTQAEQIVDVQVP